MLYIVATPIGNLEDISLRALRILKEVDLILAEDTRRTKKLLNYYQIETLVISYHQHSKLRRLNYILKLLKQGKNLALVSDAGTPGIADPGNKLVNLAIKEYNSLIISPIPGPSALSAAVSVSGLATDKFLFLGFPPTKKRRQKFFQEVINSKHTVIFYESCHRILKTLQELAICLKKFSSVIPAQAGIYNSGSPNKSGMTAEDRQIVVCRELTKKFEIIYRGTIDQVIDQLKNDDSTLCGEFVVLIGC